VRGGSRGGGRESKKMKGGSIVRSEKGKKEGRGEGKDGRKKKDKTAMRKPGATCWKLTRSKGMGPDKN